MGHRPSGSRIHYILHGFINEIRSLAFNSDRTCFVSAGYDRRIRLWDVEVGQVKQVLTGHKNVIMSVAFSRDGKWLASGDRDGIARLWHLTSRQIRSIPLEHNDKLWSVAFSPDDKMLATACDDQIVRYGMFKLVIFARSCAGIRGGFERLRSVQMDKF